MKRTMMTVLALFAAASAFAQNFRLNDRDYYSNESVDVMAFSDFYPEGHQGGRIVTELC